MQVIVISVGEVLWYVWGVVSLERGFCMYVCCEDMIEEKEWVRKNWVIACVGGEGGVCLCVVRGCGRMEGDWVQRSAGVCVEEERQIDNSIIQIDT